MVFPCSGVLKSDSDHLIVCCKFQVSTKCRWSNPDLLAVELYNLRELLPTSQRKSGHGFHIVFLSTASDGEVMDDFYNKNGKHKDTKYYYGKTSESE